MDRFVSSDRTPNGVVSDTVDRVIQTQRRGLLCNTPTYYRVTIAHPDGSVTNLLSGGTNFDDLTEEVGEDSQDVTRCTLVLEQLMIDYQASLNRIIAAGLIAGFSHCGGVYVPISTNGGHLVVSCFGPLRTNADAFSIVVASAVWSVLIARA